MNLQDINFLKNEKNIRQIKDVKLEVKGFGPSIKVLTRNKVLVTNKRIIISQKYLFRSKYRVIYIFWIDETQRERLKLFSGLLEIHVLEEDFEELEIDGQSITQLNLHKYLKNIRIYIAKNLLF